jgi:hypothetical protein
MLFAAVPGPYILFLEPTIQTEQGAMEGEEAFEFPVYEGDIQRRLHTSLLLHYASAEDLTFEGSPFAAVTDLQSFLQLPRRIGEFVIREAKVRGLEGSALDWGCEVGGCAFTMNPQFAVVAGVDEDVALSQTSCLLFAIGKYPYALVQEDGQTLRQMMAQVPNVEQIREDEAHLITFMDADIKDLPQYESLPWRTFDVVVGMNLLHRICMQPAYDRLEPMVTAVDRLMAMVDVGGMVVISVPSDYPTSAECKKQGKIHVDEFIEEMENQGFVLTTTEEMPSLECGPNGTFKPSVTRVLVFDRRE